MKHLLLLGALIFGSTSAVAAPVHFICNEVGGTFVEEGDRSSNTMKQNDLITLFAH